MCSGEYDSLIRKYVNLPDSVSAASHRIQMAKNTNSTERTPCSRRIPRRILRPVFSSSSGGAEPWVKPCLSLSLSLSLFDPPLRQHPIRRESAVIDGNEPGGERRVSHNQARQTNQNNRIPESGCCIHRSKTRPRWGNRGRKDSSFVGKLPDAMQCSKDFFCDSDGLVETALNQHCTKYSLSSVLCTLSA